MRALIHRPLALSVVGALLAIAPASAGPGDPVPGTSGSGSDQQAAAVRAFRAAADGPVEVKSDDDGGIDFIGTPEGVNAPEKRGSRRADARAHLAGIAPVLDVDPDVFEVTAVATAPGHASVVRFQQRLQGMPVIGGEVVIGLDADHGMVSASANVAREAPALTKSVDLAAVRRSALTVTARAHEVRPARLDIEDGGTWALDGDLVGIPTPGTRSVRRLQVTDGSGIDDLVLVDAATSRVLFRLDQVQEALNRRICDDQNVPNGQGTCASVAAPSRIEGGAPVGVADVNAAYDLLGATSALYQSVGGGDITALAGQSTPAGKVLAATVRWCEPTASDPTCPMDNAYWSNHQMWFGQGWAGADDVVAHEITHGVIEAHGDLFYFHESGAINESLADVIGEIVDHRNPSAGDTAGDWRLGEDSPAGALRNLANPTLFGQPDRMTSPLWTVDASYADNGGVHTNSGVGNKTAYLISQGGSFNGRTIAGIDVGDPSLNKTATLYVDVIAHLTSGSQYADLARLLKQSCDALAAAGTAGFTASNCTAVTTATAATELTSSPTVAGAARPGEAPSDCPDGRIKRVVSNNSWTAGTLWSRSPGTQMSSNTRGGEGSWFGWDPDPGNYGDPYNSSTTFGGGTYLPPGQPSYLRFDQWRLFEWASGSAPAYYDGGIVRLLADFGGGYYAEQPTAAWQWDNGPQQQLRLTNPTAPVLGFGGDSRGWTSSRVNLTPMAGQTIKPQFTVAGDASGSYIGWFLDGAEIYTCDPAPAPSGTASGTASPTASASATPTETASPTDTAGPTATVSPTVTASPTETASATPTATEMPTATTSPTTSPGPTVVPAVAPGVPASFTVRPSATALSATLSWGPPGSVGSGVTGYEVTRSDGKKWTYPWAGSVTHTVPGNTSFTYSVRTLGVSGTGSAEVRRTLAGRAVSLGALPTRVRPRSTLTLAGYVTRIPGGAVLANQVATVQYLPAGTTTWRTLKRSDGSTVTAKSASTGKLVAKVTATRGKRAYRFHMTGWLSGTTGWLRTWSTARTVTVR